MGVVVLNGQFQQAKMFSTLGSAAHALHPTPTDLASAGGSPWANFCGAARLIRQYACPLPSISWYCTHTRWGPQSSMCGSLVSQATMCALRAHGVGYSYDGLRQLLGAPISSPSFCAGPGGHLNGVVTKASALVDQIMQIDHAQVGPAACSTAQGSSRHGCSAASLPGIKRRYSG